MGAPLLRRRKLCDPLKKEKDRPLESTAFVCLIQPFAFPEGGRLVSESDPVGLKSVGFHP